MANLLRAGLVKQEAVAAAMRKVDRGWFVPQGRAAYDDAPQPIGYNVTVSAPHMHAIMLEILAPYILQRHQLNEGFRVLDVGSGSGYLTAVLAALCEAAMPRWQVVGVEHVKELAEQSATVLKQHTPAWMQSRQVCILQGDGRDPAPTLREHGLMAEGDAGQHQFDLIHVGAAAESIPSPLVELLKNGGCMVIPVGAQHETQQLLVCRKDGQGAVTVTKDCLVSFVPLTSLAFQRRNR